MNATLWQRVQHLVDQAALLSPEDFEEMLAAETQGEPELRSQVKSMLASLDATWGGFQTAIGIAAARVSIGEDLEPGDWIGPYEIAGVLGRGGMGTVYRARRADNQFHQTVAIKLVRVGIGDTSELFARFRAERQILANINHPHIARLLDGGLTNNNLPYLVMEYVEGVSLDRWLEETKPSESARLDLFCKLCSAIQYAHQNLVVHRDLKPGNVLVAADNTPKLLDFGIAKLLSSSASGVDQTMIYTRPAERLMTPEYASPEQIRGEAITTAADVYSLGVMLYELLTSTRPFRLKDLSPAQVERLICETQPRPPSHVSHELLKRPGQTQRRILSKLSDLDRIVLKAMHKDAARRYASASGLSADVQRYLAGFPVTARPDSVSYRTGKFLKRHTWGVLASASLLLMIVGLTIFSLVQARRARQEAASADAVAQYLTGLFQFTRPDATQGRSVSARDILDSGTVQLSTGWRGEPAIRARLLSIVGSIYYQLGDLDRAGTLLQEAQATQRSLADETSVEATSTDVALGDLLVDKGSYAQAESEYAAALAAQSRVHGARSLETGDARDGLSRLFWTMGDFSKAEWFERENITIASRYLRPDDDLLLTYRNNLETTLADAGEYRAASPIAQDLLERRTRSLGLMHSSTLSSMNNWAYLVIKMGRLREGEELERRTLALRQKLYGAQHPEIAMSLVSLGWVEGLLGRLDAAEGLKKRGLAMAMAMEGPDSLDTAFDQDALGLTELARGDLSAARALIHQSLAVRLSKPAPSPSRLAESYDHLGQVDLAEMRLAEARSNLVKAFQIRQSFYKVPTDATAEGLVHLGELELASKNPQRAQEHFEQALSICKTVFGDVDHPLVAEAWDGLGRSQVAEGQGAAGQVSQARAAHMRSNLGIPTQTCD